MRRYVVFIKMYGKLALTLDELFGVLFLFWLQLLHYSNVLIYVIANFSYVMGRLQVILVV